MQSNRRRDTSPELRLRRALHALGLRYRVDHPVRLGLRQTARPDVVFTRGRLAIFVDGCFWHSCPLHGDPPKSNLEYWTPKLEANRRRDRLTDQALQEGGWHVLRVWEHEPVDDAVAAVLQALKHCR